MPFRTRMARFGSPRKTLNSARVYSGGAGSDSLGKNEPQGRMDYVIRSFSDPSPANSQALPEHLNKRGAKPSKLEVDCTPGICRYIVLQTPGFVCFPFGQGVR